VPTDFGCGVIIPLVKNSDVDMTSSENYRGNCCCDTRLYFFSQRVINRWNSLSQEDVDASSINCFKNRLEKRRTRQMDFFKDI